MKVCLSQIAEFITDGTHGSPERTERGIPVLSAQNVTGGALTYSTGRYTSEDEYQAFKERLDITVGDVLLTIVGSIGRAAVVSEHKPAVFQRSVAVIRPKHKVADSRYLLHLFHSNYFQSELYRNANKSSQAGVYLGRLGSIEIPLPPLEEQRRIAAILDKAGQILSSSRQADALRQHLQVKLFISMFGDPRSNPLGWPRLSIEEITSDYVGGAALAPEDFVDQGTPVLHKGAIKAGGRIEVDSKKKGFVTPQTAQYHQRSLAGLGKVAVTLRDLVPSGPFIGLMADLSTTEIHEFLLAQGAYAFSVDTRKILPSYLIALVNIPTFRLVLRQNAVGSTQIHIRLPVFKSIEIPVPPIEKQHEFTRVISRISSVGVSSQAQIQRIDELTRSLQSSFLE